MELLRTQSLGFVFPKRLKNTANTFLEVLVVLIFFLPPHILGGKPFSTCYSSSCSLGAQAIACRVKLYIRASQVRWPSHSRRFRASRNEKVSGVKIASAGERARDESCTILFKGKILAGFKDGYTIVRERTIRIRIRRGSGREKENCDSSD